MANLNNFQTHIPNSSKIPPIQMPTRKPEILCKIGIKKLLSNQIDNPYLLEPIYIGGSQHTSTGQKN